MKLIKLFESFNFESELSDLIKSIPDSDIPSQTNIITKIDDKIIYIEGWCDRCFSNYDVYDRDEMVEMAKELGEKRLKNIPLQPQYRKRFDGYELEDNRFYDLCDNSYNYCLSVGIYTYKK
jgi:hypothetical protein